MNSRLIMIKTVYSLIVMLFIMVIAIYLILPYFRIDRVNLLDPEIKFSRDITTLAGLNSYSSFLFLNTKRIEDKLMSEPLVRKVSVEKSFPDTLNIRIFGRDALAMAYDNRAGESVPLCFDENGVLFLEGDEVSYYDLPVLTGDMDFSGVSKGATIPKAVIPLLANLKEIRAKSPDLYSSISEISIIKKGDMTFDMVLFFTFTPIRAIVGSVLTPEQLESIVVLNSLLQRDKVSVEEVDFRSEEIVYREVN